MDFIKNINFNDKNSQVKYGAILVIIIIIIGYIVYVSNKRSSSAIDKNCSILKKLYKSKPPLISILDNNTHLSKD